MHDRDCIYVLKSIVARIEGERWVECRGILGRHIARTEPCDVAFGVALHVQHTVGNVGQNLGSEGLDSALPQVVAQPYERSLCYPLARAIASLFHHAAMLPLPPRLG